MSIYSDADASGRIERREVNACVVGVGTIGLPLATFLSSKGFDVTGFDVNQKRADSINDGSVKFEYTDILSESLKNGKIRATTDPSEIGKADVVFVCVPTPLNKEMAIDLTILEKATETVARNMSKGVVVIYESSVSIGSTKKMSEKLEEISGMKLGQDFGVGYCPERYNPTLPKENMPHVVYEKSDEVYDDVYKYTVNKVSRVISATDGKSLEIAKGMYSTFIESEIKEVSSIETAEATKLLENIFRDVNIALANEMAKLLPMFGVDAYEVVNAAKTKQFAFLPHYPGTGVGGECIPVDTWYLIKQAEAAGFDTKLMKVAREVNDSMPSHVTEMVEKALKEKGRDISGSKVTVLGVSYKKNIADTRLSPSIEIIESLESKGAEVVSVDPVMEMSGSSHSLTHMTDAFKGSDAIVMATDHDVFRGVDTSKVGQDMRTKIVVDGRNFFDKEKLESEGFVYMSVGKPR